MSEHSLQPQIGLIGLGLLGSAIADRLRAAGWVVTGYDIEPARREAFAAAGGQTAESPAEVCRAARRIVLSLPTSEVVDNVITAMWDAVQPESLVIDTTTGDPEQMEQNGARLAARDVVYVEATVAGSSAQVRSGQATVFLGGPRTAIETCLDIFAALAAEHFHLGPVGAASRFKLVHNLLLGLNRAALAEALVFAEGLGFPGDRTLEVLKQTPAASRVMDTKGEKMVRSAFDPQARLSQHLKDVRLILDLAQQVNVATPLSELHRTLLEHAEALGFGAADNSAIIEALRTPNHD